jgi:hypothetical protein
MPKLAIAVIHGMGDHSPGYSVPMRDAINDLVRKAGKDPAEIEWNEIFWADILKGPELQYLSNIRNSNDGQELGYADLRKFVVTALGDAAGYHSSDPAAPDSTYQKIQGRIKDSLSKFGDLNCPLVVMAHSLGCTMITDYIWDMQRSGNAVAGGLSPIQRFDTLAGMVTFGCNLPLFTFAYDPVEVINFPGPVLTDDQNSKAKWINIFSNDDILGYPLKPLNDAYNRVVAQDLKVNVGTWPASRTPLCHGMYWTDSEFTKPTTDLISGFLDEKYIPNP